MAGRAFAAVLMAGLLSGISPAAADMAALLAQRDLYGHSILGNADVAAAARRLAGRDYDTFAGILNVSPPAVKVSNRYVFGQGCRPHQCDTTGALIVVDTRQKKVFMAMTDGPVRKSWPGGVQSWPSAIRDIVRRSYE